MPILAALVEDNGWVLRLDVTGSLGSFASYALDPDTAPRIVLTSLHAGFVRSGGQAVSGTLNRSLVGTKPLRRPALWTGATLAAAVVDETDLGGGVIRTRIALSEHVYASDTGLALAVGAGWRTGEVAASGLAVANASTVVAPIPVMRWALLPYGVTAGSFTLALFVASHHPVGLDPVAGVRFTATDGVTVKSVWTTALSTDASYGDNLRCYTASIDPATATALNAGILRCDAEVYPWLGGMRSTDPLGTRAMTGLSVDGRRTDAQSPWMIGYDPASSRYNSQFAFVDPVNGTTTASAAMIAPTLAGAKAVAPAARPRTIAVALQAGYLANRTLPAANGNPAQTRSVDGLQCVLAAGVHPGMGTTSPTTGIAALEIPVRIYGDPANANPRANCILQTAVTGTLRVTRYHLSDMTIEMGIDALTVGGIIWTFDNVEFRGKAGQTGGSVGLLTPSPSDSVWNVGITRCRWWRYGGSVMAGNPRIGLFRANAFARPVASFLFAATNRLIGNAEDPTVGTTPFTALNSYSAPGLAAQVEDIIIAYNDLRFLRGRAWGLSQISGAIAGTPNASLRRQVMIGNIVERIGDTAEPFYAFGEDTSATMTYNIIEANSFVGDRANTFYSDPLPATLAAVDTQRNQALVNRVANNCFDWLPTKHDDFNDPTAAQRRGTANGYRPQMVEAWSMLYGVGHEGNVDHNRVSGGNFPLEFSGLRSRNGYAGQLNPQYASDRSIEGPDGLAAPGGGDYTPAATAPAAGRGLRGNSDVDAVGRLRTLPFTAGALQVAAIDLLAQPAQSGHSVTAPALALVPAAPLAPAGARSGTLAGAATLGWLAGLDPAAAVCGTRAGAAVLDWRADLVPVASALDSAASATGLMLTLALLPGSAILLTGAAGSEIEAMSRFLHPDPALLATGAAAARLTLPPGTPVATIIIGADPRTLTPFRP